MCAGDCVGECGVERVSVFMKKDLRHKDRLVRWQSTLREQVSFLNNLLFTISIGIIGFCISLLEKESFKLSNCIKFLFTFGLILIIFSNFLGLSTVCNRLRDFKATVDKIRYDTSDNNEIKDLNLYGKITWGLLCFQIITFIIGVLSLLLSFGLIYYTKLF